MLKIGCHLSISIGFEGISKIINHPQLYNLPFFLETPNDLNGHREEIKKLRQAYKY